RALGVFILRVLAALAIRLGCGGLLLLRVFGVVRHAVKIGKISEDLSSEGQEKSQTAVWGMIIRIPSHTVWFAMTHPILPWVLVFVARVACFCCLSLTTAIAFPRQCR